MWGRSFQDRPVLRCHMVRGGWLAIGITLIVAIGSFAVGRTSVPAAAIPPLGTPGAATTSRADLAQTIAAMRARVSRNAGDAEAAIVLADALIRQTRVT